MSSSSQLFEAQARVLVESAFDRGAGFRRRRGAFLPELAQKCCGGYASRLRPGGRAHRAVGGDDGHGLGSAVLRSEALDEVVGMVGETDFKRSDGCVRPCAVEDDHTARALQSYVPGEPIHELVPVTEVARMQNVVPVEEKEHGAKDARR
jgi:hypothetical protein